MLSFMIHYREDFLINATASKPSYVKTSKLILTTVIMAIAASSISVLHA